MKLEDARPDPMFAANHDPAIGPPADSPILVKTKGRAKKPREAPATTAVSFQVSNLKPFLLVSYSYVVLFYCFNCSEQENIGCI